jgi:hypothetical protein
VDNWKRLSLETNRNAVVVDVVIVIMASVISVAEADFGDLSLSSSSSGGRNDDEEDGGGCLEVRRPGTSPSDTCPCPYM